jgi:hypothetical protein
MQGLTPLEIVSDGLQKTALPTLVRPDPSRLSATDDPKEVYILWAIQYYVYSVIAHVRTVLRGLVLLAKSGNIPTAFVVCRHVFEWAAQVCYMNENLAKYVSAKDWNAARDLLNKAVIGSKWIKEHGHKYDPVQVTSEIPDTIRLNKVLASYEAHLKETYGTEAKDDYSHLSEHSHPNAACFTQYHDEDASEVRFIEPSVGSPLPVVNWCLIDLTTLLLSLLKLSREQTVRPQIAAIQKELARLAAGKRR